MKAIQIRRTGGPEVLEYVELPTPEPGPGEVLVRAHAVGVHYFDMLIRSGRYRWMPELPFVLGNDMSGRVAAAGAGARLKTGQPVFIAGWDIGFRGGLYADYAAVPEKDIWPLPDGIDLDQAAALSNYALAWTLLHQVARGIAPRTVLVYGAAGGMGTALIDIARLAGARVIGLAGGEEKCAFVRARGAEPVDHAREAVVARVNALTGGRGADIIFNHVAGKTFADDLQMLAPLGLIVSYAVLGGMPETDLFKDMRANIEKSPALRCFTMHTSDALPELRRDGMQHAIALLAAKKITPAITARLPLAEAARAHELLQQRRAMGKILLKPEGASG
ncbi:MAG TPA: NADPH:quinone reductase [Xanthobacteraceae bacterium]|nr:NADPH:quinone reductase [Xanthobacteraceae bacterium]